LGRKKNIISALKQEFKDAIASLSPEQQQFAKAFRAMQLEPSGGWMVLT